MIMGLSGNALRAAIELISNFPQAKITSGRRTIAEQVSAMAENIVADRGWVAATYKPSKASGLCVQWCEQHPNATAGEIRIGLGVVLRALPDVELSKLSKHLSGEAFDVRPIEGDAGKRVKSFLQMLAVKYNGKFLEKEGNLVRWHIQF